ncbi:hypothetical protein [Aurantiacibacter marinus]|uniref:Aspartate-semialdehyde dehydrogenase n=1 Tax=Aurantiacibacter marinus TaxID=874156 RepID=A0A0H0XM28_9SPHN|nr:hypothetical protein [Aurantiacibacter marinus]KLI63668.1 hypothetical protein AAV99_08000 [Aurantiacibacter marinus]
MRLAYLALPLFALAACSQEPAAEGDAAGMEATAPLEDATLDLQATGITIPAQNGFEQLDVPFGSMRAPTEATLANVVGASTGTFDAVEGETDCRLNGTSFEGISVSFNADSFVGYYATAPYVPQLTRAEMLADPAVSLVEESSLGEEFTIGEGEQIISGVFSGAGDDAVVEALWAGENCIAR